MKQYPNDLSTIFQQDNIMKEHDAQNTPVE